jgi:flagellin
MVALQNLRSINKGLTMVQEQISTGKKVGNARDNAAIFAISTVMQSDVKGFEAISQSLNLGSSSVGVARGAAEKVTELLVEMKGLIVAAQEDNVDRAKIQTDVEQLRDQIDSIVNAAQFNGLNFLKGASSTDFLASLDRDSSGNVTASSITVDAFSL